MNKHIYTAGISALALLIGALPVAALAENGGGGEGSANVRVQALGLQASTSIKARIGEGKTGEQENALRATSSARMGEQEEINEDQYEQEGVPFMLESSTTQAHSFADLERTIEKRKQQLAQDIASTTPANQDIVRNANPVRLAVHSLLASRNLLGGIGPQVSEIAKHMNDAVATTTQAEAKIQSRSFLVRLFFGGDTTAADAIAQAATQNQANIQKLTDLLGQASTTPDVQATLTAQIAALQDAQARLQALALKEQKAWGLFSWRF